MPVCQEGLEFDDDLGFCVPTECAEGQVLDEESGLCIIFCKLFKRDRHLHLRRRVWSLHNLLQIVQKRSPSTSTFKSAPITDCFTIYLIPDFFASFTKFDSCSTILGDGCVRSGSD